LLRDVYDAFDYIILDSAPVMVADDTASLAPKIDACIYVVRFSFSSARVSRKALDLLKSRQANVIGLVCNDVHASMPEYYYYYQYSEYYGAKAKSGA
jgi:Mrp family chromosome partitioning ATPase